jgi:dTDP-4-dehydrorhamnose 3,5-epimerase
LAIKDIEIKESKVFGKDVMIFKPSVFYDHRGNIYTTYSKDIYQKYLPEGEEFIHDKFAESKNNVLRGLHGDKKTWKLVSCVFGEIYEVVVDMRPDSPNYKKWEGWDLSSDNYRQVLIPPNFVNGYYVKSDRAVFHYKLAYDGSYIDADDQMTIRWNDESLNINWPCRNPILQKRDK